MPKTLLAGLLAAAFIITGCSTPASTTGEPQPAAEAEGAGPTVEQFASIIAEDRRDVDDWLDDWHDNSCSTLGVSGGDIACEISLMTGGLIAETARLGLDSATKESSLVYIGDPPKEIATIWQSTVNAATAAAEAGVEIPDECSSDDGCADYVMNFVSAMGTLQSKYDSWEPYL